MDPHERYRHLLLCAQLPPLHAVRRRRLVARLRFEAALPLWCQSLHRTDLRSLVVKARDHGPSWTW